MQIPEPVSVRLTTRKSPIAWLLEALYLSRSREARRVIRRYRHLLADDGRGHSKIVATTDTQFRDCSAHADRDQTPRRAIHRTFEDA